MGRTSDLVWRPDRLPAGETMEVMAEMTKTAGIVLYPDFEELDAVGPYEALGDVDVKEGVRWVHDGNVITSAGVSAGIDMALYLVSLLKNEQISASVQKMMEYYPQPPVFDEVPA